MVEVYQSKGLSKDDSITIVDIISKDPEVFVNMMMLEELELILDMDDKWGPLKQGTVMFISFITFGLLPPMLGFMIGVREGPDFVFGFSMGMMGMALLVLGAIKGYLTSLNMFISAVLMVLNGAISGGVSYGMGVIVTTALG